MREGGNTAGKALSLTDFCARAREPGAILSGPAQTDFREGWAKMPFVGKRSHFWRLHTSSPNYTVHESLCKQVAATTLQAPAFGVGNTKLCVHCQRIAKFRHLPLPTARERRLWIDHLEPKGGEPPTP